MDKIYSRPRIKIPRLKIGKWHINGNKEKNTKVKKMTIFVVILIIAFGTMKFVLNAIMPIFDNLCTNKAESIATTISNEQSSIVMKDYNYDELYTIEKDNEGNVSMIKANAISINEISSNIADKIQQEIDKRGKENIEIAMRKFYRI